MAHEHLSIEWGSSLPCIGSLFGSFVQIIVSLGCGGLNISKKACNVEAVMPLGRGETYFDQKYPI